MNRKIHKKRHPFLSSVLRKNNAFLVLGVVKNFKLMGMYGEAYRQIQEQSKQLLTSFLRLFHLLDKNGRKSHRYRKKTVFDILGIVYEQHIEQ
ncbi:hypothetical protein ACQVTU_19210 [Bacillus cereus]|uniref:hypothetical protein n=1 Tax=Bacillus cereus TaxID=1396 RepID=UPI003D65F415